MGNNSIIKTTHVRHGARDQIFPAPSRLCGEEPGYEANHEPHQAILSASMSSETTLLESIAEISDRQVAKTAKSSIFFLSSPCLPPAWHHNG